MDRDITRRTFFGGTLGVGLSLALGAHGGASTGMDTAKGRRLERIDCTQEYPPEQYFGHGNVTVVDAAAGRYREAEGRPLSRFGYRFRIEHVGKPHVAVICYPDDKRRYMCIMDGTCYDLTTGVFTDWAQPLSGEMLELRQVFWPRWEDCSLVFMTWSEGEPVAAASIEIWELEDLPTLETPGDPGDGSRRELGIQYEDPCGCCASEGAMNREEWLDHLTSYAKHSGQNLLAYPIAWYHGPQFPCDCQPADSFGVAVARDRKQYSRWTSQPVDWLGPVLERFGREGLGFQGAMTLMRLGHLLENMNIDLAAIQAGAETYNNMLWNNQVQAATHDWTGMYNARNFDIISAQVPEGQAIEPFSALPQLLYGEQSRPGCHMGPMFNPLHPTVQQAIIEFVTEIGRRYGQYPAFKGVSFNMFASCMPWFGSIHAGYDDYTIALFQQETGISLPVDPKTPDRFSARYEYLMFACRPAWVDWRCRKIRALFGEIRHALAAARPDLRVTITLWDETLVPGVLGYPSPALQFGARRNMLELWRDAGIDPALYQDAPGLEIDRGMGNSRDRGGHGSNPCGGVNLPIDQLTMYRDFDFLDQDSLEAIHALPRPGVFVFNCWVEAWGRHVWFKPEPGDPNLAEMSVMDGQPVDGILRINSEYPEDGFWFDSQLRITPGFPGGIHFLEPYAHALAEMDACRITRGGLFLDKAHTEALQQFARPYRALPKEKFATIGGTTDPVAVRTLVKDGRRYLYAVNWDCYPVELALAFSAAPAGLRDLATDEAIEAPAAWRILLAPYELRAFGLDPDVEVAGFEAQPPEAVTQALASNVEEALAAFEKLRATGGFIPGMDDIETRIQTALAQGRVAWLRRALTGYTVRSALARATG